MGNEGEVGWSVTERDAKGETRDELGRERKESERNTLVGDKREERRAGPRPLGIGRSGHHPHPTNHPTTTRLGAA